MLYFTMQLISLCGKDVELLIEKKNYLIVLKTFGNKVGYNKLFFFSIFFFLLILSEFYILSLLLISNTRVKNFINY